MKRPLVYAAGGFVLGEVWLLLNVEGKAVIPVLVTAGVFCLWKKRKCRGPADTSGRSLTGWFLPLFFFALLGAGRLAADGRLAERREAQMAAVRGTALRLEGTLDDVGPGKEGSYVAVLTLSDVAADVRGEARQFEGKVLVYLDEWPGEREAGEEKAAWGAGVMAGKGAGAAKMDSGKVAVAANEPPDVDVGTAKMAAKLASSVSEDGGKLKAGGEPEDGGKPKGGGEPGRNGLRIGMRVSVRGELEPMGQATNPGEFDFGRYYHALGIGGRMFGEDLQIAEERYSPYLDGIFRLKQWARELFVRLCGAGGGVNSASMNGTGAEGGDAGGVSAVNHSMSRADSGGGVDSASMNGTGAEDGSAGGVSAVNHSMNGADSGSGGVDSAGKNGAGTESGDSAGGSADVVSAGNRSADGGDAGLFTAIVLGDKTALTEDVREFYQKNGIAHLLAVSGLHISLIGMGFYRLLRRRIGLPPGLAGTLAAAVTVSYGILTGGSASVVRAVAMVCLQILADKLGRTYDMLSAMALAAILILLDSPSLLFQAGFQLSFGAVLAVGAAYPVLESWTKVRRQVWKTVLLGVVIQVVTLPVTLFHFYEYPVYGTVLNLLVIPLMGYVLVSGLAGLACGAVWLPAGRFAVGTGHFVLAFYESLCHAFERLPGAVQVVGRPRMWQLGVYAALWCAALLLASRTAEKEKDCKEGENGGGISSGCRMAALAVCACMGYLLLQPRPVPGLRVTFLDVGQGDGICLENGKMTVLVDGGSTSRKDLGKQVLEPYLKYRGISRIDFAVVSHCDEDHISGLRYLLEADRGIAVGTLVLPMLAEGDERYEELEKMARRAGAEVAWMKPGDWIGGKGNGESADGLLVRCLYAGEPAYREEANDHSLLLEVRYGSAGLLLTGDMGAEGERRWLEGLRVAGKNGAEEPVSGEKDGAEGNDVSRGLSGPVQLLKAAHHGSNYSSSREFLESINPAWAVISCARKNRYGHPGEETLERLEDCGIEVFLTMDGGAVTVTADGEEIEAECYLY